MSATAVIYDLDMSRWEPNARGRLEQAAMELYSERGFEQTTVAEIARRAGLTERTFFRHFADKREVLFGGAGQLDERLKAAVAAAPDSASPFESMTLGLEAVAVLLHERRDFARRRQAVITANAELQERELIKLASWATALADALRERAVDASTATLVGEVGIAVFRIAFQRWLDDADEPHLSDVIRESLDKLRTLAAEHEHAPVAPTHR
jgi:AcrR family transcriptional regulator